MSAERHCARLARIVRLLLMWPGTHSLHGIVCYHVGGVPGERIAAHVREIDLADLSAVHYHDERSLLCMMRPLVVK